MSKNLAVLLWIIICVATARGYDCGGTYGRCQCVSGSMTIDCSGCDLPEVEHFDMAYRTGKVLDLTNNKIVTYKIDKLRGFASVLLQTILSTVLRLP